MARTYAHTGTDVCGHGFRDCPGCSTVADDLFGAAMLLVGLAGVLGLIVMLIVSLAR